MKIDAIRLRHVRRFGPEGIAFEGLTSGLNVYCAPNESGKSTLLEAMRAALFFKATSSAAVIQSLKTEGAAADPYVELDFEAGGRDLRLIKRFAGGRRDSTTKLVERTSDRVFAQEGEAEDWLKTILEGDKPHLGPTGVLWLSQGESLSFALSGAPLAGDQVRTLDGLLSGEVTDVAGGGETQVVRDLAAAQLATLETPRNRKVTGRLAEAIAALETLQAKRRELEAEVGRAGDLRRRLVDLRRVLGDLDDPADREARTLERQEAEKRAFKAAALRAERGHTEEWLAARKDDVVARRESLTAFDVARKELEDRTKSFGMAQSKRDELKDELGSAEATQQCRREREETIRRAVSDLEAKLQVYADHAGMAERTREREGLAKSVEEGEGLVEAIRSVEGRAARKPIDLTALRRAYENDRLSRAKLEAASPELVVEAGGPVRVDGQTVGEGQSAVLRGDGRIEVGGTLLRIVLPGREQLLRARAEAAEKLDGLLRTAGAADLAEAERLEEERREAVAEAERYRRDLLRIAPEGLDALKLSLERMSEAATPAPLPSEPREGLEAQRAGLREEASRLAEESAAAEARLAALRERVVEARIAAERLEQQRSTLQARLGPETERDERRAALVKAVTDLEDRVGGYQHRLLTLEKELREAEAAEATLKRLDEAEGAIQRERQRCSEDAARIEGELSGLYKDGAEQELAAVGEEEDAAQKHLDELETRRRALRLLIDMIDEEEEARRDQVVRPVMAELDPMLEHLYGAALLRFGSEWSPAALDRPGQPSDVGTLSAGTREQLAVLTRLAFAQMMAKRGSPVPVILDDALTYADDARARRLFDILRRVGEHAQVIVLTCHERLFRDLGGNVMTPRPFTERE